jgi:hypothetical protein
MSFWFKDPIGSFWEILLASVNISWRESGLRTAGHGFLLRKRSSWMPPFLNLDWLRSGLLDGGVWKNGVVGDILTEEADPVKVWVYMAFGLVEIRSGVRVLNEFVPVSSVG